MTSTAKNLVGQHFGKLTVIKRVGTKHRKALWLCHCECGNEKTVTTDQLTTGQTKSCGCLKNIDKIKHHKTGTRLYIIWANIKQRCYNIKSTSYKRYGARGITLCSEWQQFEPFYNWAIQNGYQDNLSIDRIDNNGNYEPANCRWTTRKEQARNTRRNRYITINQKTHCLSEWAEIKGIKISQIEGRLRDGWTYERAIMTPFRNKAKRRYYETV